MLKQKRLKELLHYDPETGAFTWIRRSEQTRFDRMWNTRFAGKLAGYPRPDGYRQIRIHVKPYLAHRLAWLYIYGCLPKEQIDHVNHIRDDNRIANLREATHKDNRRNQSRSSRNTSGVTGVCWKQGKWQARIKVDGRNIHIGYFNNFEKAVEARKAAEIHHKFHNNHGNPRKTS